jgi:hypothetical protein
MRTEALFESNHELEPRSSISKCGRRFSKDLVLILLIGMILPAGSPSRAHGGDDAMFIDEKGNVGIGTQHPEQKLQVVGKVKALSFEGDGAVPKGVIVMWSGEVDQIPDGWTLCDGSHGTPDLRSRFIVGAGPGGDLSYAPRASGDPDKLPPVSVTTEPAGEHQHKFPAKYYARNFLCGVAALGKNWCTGIDTSGSYQKEQPTQAAGIHSHTVAINFDEANSGENRPRWYALCFIMKL